MTFSRQSAVVLILLSLTIVGMAVPSAGGFVGTAQAQYGGSTGPMDVEASDLPGDGSRSSPYEISNASELQAMEDDLDANYELVSDIDASKTAEFNNGRGFDPIGTFRGTFDGTDHTITGLTIDRPDESDVGLFATSSGIVTNVTLAEVTVTGDSFVGGLVGANRETIQDASASGNVTGGGSVGGLVGCNNGTIRTATASGNVDGLIFTGGLVGIIDEGGMIVNATASGNVDGSDFTGGLVGVTDENVVIKNATASGGVSGTNATGGLVGLAENGSTITNATASGNVDGSDFTGGLVGFSDEDVIIKDATASGGVSGSDSVGGLVGQSRGRIMNATACGNVDGLALTGGLVGFNEEDGVIANVTASGGVGGSDNVGGLAGQNNGTITTARALSNTEGESDVGGLLGANIGTVRNTTASGTVSADEFAGGLIGVHNGIVQDSFAVGNVTATADAGGLVASQSQLGEQGTVRDSYFDEQATDQDTSVGAAIGLTTAEMQGAAAEQNMTGLEFGETWRTVSGDYPALIAEADSPEQPESVSRITFEYQDFGGEVNLEVNDDRRVERTLPAFDGKTIGGATVEVPRESTGTEGEGLVIITGEIDSFSVGGIESNIDNVTLEREGNSVTTVEFESLTPTQSEYGVGEEFTSSPSGVTLSIEPFTFSDGDTFRDGRGVRRDRADPVFAHRSVNLRVDLHTAGGHCHTNTNTNTDTDRDT